MKRISWFLSLMMVFLLVSTALGAPITGRASRGITQANPDTNETPMRAGRYGEFFTIGIPHTKHVLSDEGSYFVTTNVIGTAVSATTSITAYADTTGAVGNFFYWRNGDTTGGKRVYIDYIKLLVTAIPTSATSWQWALVTDYGTARYVSGGTQFIPVSPNGDIGTPSIVTFWAGALSTTAGVSKRTVGRGTFRGVVPTVFDTYVIVCGSLEGAGTMASAAASGRTVDNTAPIILGPGQNLTLAMWGAANAAVPTFEFEIGHWER